MLCEVRTAIQFTCNAATHMLYVRFLSNSQFSCVLILSTNAMKYQGYLGKTCFLHIDYSYYINQEFMCSHIFDLQLFSMSNSMFACNLCRFECVLKFNHTFDKIRSIESLRPITCSMPKTLNKYRVVKSKSWFFPLLVIFSTIQIRITLE